MKTSCEWKGGVGGFLALLGSFLLFLTACSTAAPLAAPPSPAAALSDDDDFSELIAQLRTDLNRYNGRQPRQSAVPASPSTPVVETRKERDHEFAARARALFSGINGLTLQMPVVGIVPAELRDSWGNSRDGGRRKHKGIDIFAPRGTAIVAVMDGIITYIGEQPKGGRCLWLSTDDGTSFYYAHLDRWAAGLYEGMSVRSGDLLGYVGNTGNAKYTPSHLHFGVNENDEMVNPFPILTHAMLVKRPRVTVESAASMGTR